MERDGVPPGQHRYNDDAQCRDCGTLRVKRTERDAGGWRAPSGWYHRQEPSCWFVIDQNNREPLK